MCVKMVIMLLPQIYVVWGASASEQMSGTMLIFQLETLCNL